MGDVGGDVGDNGSKHFVLKENAQLDEAAATCKVDTPLFLSIVLIIYLDVTDAFKEHLDEEVFVSFNEVQGLALLLHAGDLHLGDCRPEFDTLGADLALVVLGNVACHLADLLDVATNHVVFKSSDLDEALHSSLSNRHIRGLQGLVKDLGHDEVTLCINLKVCRSVGD